MQAPGFDEGEERGELNIFASDALILIFLLYEQQYYEYD